LLMSQGSKNGIQNLVQVLADILCQESQNKVPVLLKRTILSAVTAIGISVREMLCSIQFDHEPILGAEKIDFHSSHPLKRNGKLDIQAKAVSGRRKGLETPIEERLVLPPPKRRPGPVAPPPTPWLLNPNCR